jgi:hypothetical protein
LPKRKSRSQLVALAAVAVGLLSGGAGVASAAPAVFNTTGGAAFNMTGVTINWGPQSSQTVNCPSAIVGFNATNSGSPLQGSLPNPGEPFYQQQCTTAGGAAAGGVLISPQASLLAESSAGAFSLRSTKSLKVFFGMTNRSTLNGPNTTFTVPWTNPSGPNASKFTFSNKLIGYFDGSTPVYLSATLTTLFPTPLSLS